MSNLKDIHNWNAYLAYEQLVALSGFQWAIWRIYTTWMHLSRKNLGCFIRISMSNLKDIHNKLRRVSHVGIVALSGFQWAIWRIYTTKSATKQRAQGLLYQDFNEQFEGYTQRSSVNIPRALGCFIRISMSNLKDIHNWLIGLYFVPVVALSGFQWAIWRIYTTVLKNTCVPYTLFYQDFNEQRGT